MAKKIKFGTDGWRAIIADQYTFDNLERVTLATANWLQKTYDIPSVVLGYDTRFLGRHFAEYAARLFAAQGIPVLLSETFTSTPAISWATEHYRRSAGIVITASHNPPEYNGFKIKAHYGGPASPTMIAAVEAEIDVAVLDEPPASLATFIEGGTIERADLTSAYLEAIRERIDIRAIRKAGLKVAHDAMYGAGQGMISRLLGPENVIELRSVHNPDFSGQAPEPIERNLARLAEVMVEEGCNVGLANDGDADRIGMYDENGKFVDSHQLLALLIKYLHHTQGLTGNIVKTFSTTHMLDRMGEAYGLKVETTPIGFKYIGSKIVEGDVLVGGEESGGMAVKGHIPERDGIYIGLLVVEMMVKRGKKLSELVQELFDQFGAHHTYREDVHTTDAKKQAVLARLRNDGGLSEVNGQAVQDFQTLDGFKHLTEAGWLLVRPSGTEPVLRIYSEATSPEAARAYVRDARKQLGVA